MTLQPYTPQRLDQLALRILDVCGRVRDTALRARDHSLEEFQLHDKKALEWLERLEEWAQKAADDVDLAVRRERGSRRASEAAGKN